MHRIKAILDANPQLRGRGSILVVKATDAVHPNPEKDRRGCYKRGMIVAVVSDRNGVSGVSALPTFAHLWIPLVAPEVLRKYAEEQRDLVFPEEPYRRRQWQLRWNDLPAGARNQLQSTGALIIKAHPAYTLTHDYTWPQVRNYLWDLLNDRAETGEI